VPQALYILCASLHGASILRASSRLNTAGNQGRRDKVFIKQGSLCDERRRRFKAETLNGMDDNKFT
jgi:hypothetical protein